MVCALLELLWTEEIGMFLSKVLQSLRFFVGHLILLR